MNYYLNIINRKTLSFIIPFFLIFGLIFFIKTPAYLANSELLTLPITIDLLVVIPLIYFLLIRKSNIPKTTIIPFVIIGLIVGLNFLPKENHSYLNLFKNWILPIIEMFILGFVVYKIRMTRKKYKSIQNSSTDLFTNIKEACIDLLPTKVIIPFATEIAVIFYTFLKWKKRKLNPNEYSIHKNSSTPAIMFVLIFAIAIETFAIHLLLLKWSETAAWILTGISIYTAIQVFGLAKSITQRPIVINDNELILRFGLIKETKIKISNISKIELTTKSIEDDKSILTLSPLGSADYHNMIIYLKEEIYLIGLYGFKKPFTKIAFNVDEKDIFKKKLEKQLQAKTNT